MYNTLAASATLKPHAFRMAKALTDAPLTIFRRPSIASAMYLYIRDEHTHYKLQQKRNVNMGSSYNILTLVPPIKQANVTCSSLA